MAGDFDVDTYRPLLQRARAAFSTDTAYAIAVAKQAGALVARKPQDAATEVVEPEFAAV